MEHFYEKIDGWFNCAPLYEYMVKNAKEGDVFVEVGVWKGKSAAFMGVEIINSKKKIDFYAVDHFEGSIEHKDNPSVSNNTLKDECYKNLEPVMSVVKMLPVKSTEAAKIFADKSIDFIYLDGSHEYDDLKADIEAWFPKLKDGGVMGGDDYNVHSYPDVKTLIDQIFPMAGIQGFVWSVKKI